MNFISTVKDLVKAANGAVQEKAEEEALVASAKGVAAATARLVFASRAKADPFRYILNMKIRQNSNIIRILL
jgi:hypothetical protein